MAKRKIRRVARRSSPRALPKRRTSKRPGNSTKKVSAIIVSSMIYGGLRAKASNIIAPYTAKIPLGSIGDEIGMAGLSYLVATKTTGLTRDIALNGLVIENARIGEAIADGSVNLGSLGNKSNAGTKTGYPV